LKTASKEIEQQGKELSEEMLSAVTSSDFSGVEDLGSHNFDPTWLRTRKSAAQLLKTLVKKCPQIIFQNINYLISPK